MTAEGSASVDEIAAVEIGEDLARVYAEVYERSMRDVPICNHEIAVEAIGFRAFGAYVFGIVMTPWFMNLIAVTTDRVAPGPDRAGSTIRIALPAGDVDLIAGELAFFGEVQSCSLFSPMFDFDTSASARATAEEILKALFEPAVADPPAQPRALAAPDRRAFLRGRLHAEEGCP